MPTHSLRAFFWHFMRPHRLACVLILMSPILLMIESAYVPYIIRQVVNIVIRPDVTAATIWDAIGVMMFSAWAAYVIMMMGFRGQEMLGNRTYPRIHAAIRMIAFDYVLHHSHHYFTNQFAGSLASKVGDLPRTFQSLFFFVQWQIFGTLAMLIASLGVMAFVSIPIALMLLLWVVFHIGMTLITVGGVSRLSSTNSEDRNRLNGQIVDSLSNNNTVRLFAAFRHERTSIQPLQDAEQHSHAAMLWRITLVRWVQDAGIAVVLMLVGIAMVEGWREGLLTAGDFVYIFYATFNIMFFIWHNSSLIPNFFSEMGVARQALSMLQAPHTLVDSADAKELIVSNGEIKLERVQFAYENQPPLFSDQTLTIPAGQKVGLVGFSGSGKSTFVHLILRLYEVDQGSISIDNQNINEVTQASLHRAIAFIPQDTSLFHRSLMDNIRYAKPDATDDEVIEASRAAFCHEFITAQAQGYNTMVGERGIKLSGGQRQRIAIARAILKNAPILMLDEATAALDSVTEHQIQHSLHRLMDGRTTILIAHRLSTLSQMDRILVFDKGRIIEDGTHSELLEMGGHYAKLWQLQTQGELAEI